MIQITQADYIYIKSTIATLKQVQIIERNKILDTFRCLLPGYKEKLKLIDVQIDLLDKLEELLK